MLLGAEAQVAELANHHRVLVLMLSDGKGVGGVSLTLNVLSAHPEDHGGSAAVLYSGVAGQLEEIGVGQHGSDVIALLLEFAHNFDGDVVLLVPGSLELSVESDDGARTTAKILMSHCTYTTCPSITVPAS